MRSNKAVISRKSTDKLMVDTLEAYRRVIRPLNPETGEVYKCWELLEKAMILEDPPELEIQK